MQFRFRFLPLDYLLLTLQLTGASCKAQIDQPFCPEVPPVPLIDQYADDAILISSFMKTPIYYRGQEQLREARAELTLRVGGAQARVGVCDRMHAWTAPLHERLAARPGAADAEPHSKPNDAKKRSAFFMTLTLRFVLWFVGL